MVLTIRPSRDSARIVRSAAVAAAGTSAGVAAGTAAGLSATSGCAAASGAETSNAPPKAVKNILDMVLLLSGFGRGEAGRTVGRARRRLDSPRRRVHSPLSGESDQIAAALLGLVEGGVGARDQMVAAFAAGEQGHAGADRDPAAGAIGEEDRAP